MSFADGVTLLPALVKKFHDLHPDALVHLEAGYEPGLLKKLKDGDINFAILENESVEEGSRRRRSGTPSCSSARPTSRRTIRRPNR